MLHVHLPGSPDPTVLEVFEKLLPDAPLERLGDMVVQRSRPYSLMGRSQVMTVRGVRPVSPPRKRARRTRRGGFGTAPARHERARSSQFRSRTAVP